MSIISESIQLTLGGRLHNPTAGAAGSQFFRTVEFLKNALKLGSNILKLKIFLVEFVVAVFTEPHQPVEFTVAAFAFDD